MKRLYYICLLLIALLSVENSQAQTEVTFYTNKGNFVVRLYDTIAPITSKNFKELVLMGFYDGVIFHRVINAFMIQGGDPTGTGFGGPGYSIPDEFSNKALNIQKSISMANSGPNTGGSQFFINLVNNAHLNNKHAVFGMTISGFNIVQDIGKVPVNSQNRPIDDVIMDSIRVTTWPVGISKPAPVEMVMNIYPNPVSSESDVSLFIKKEAKMNFTIIDQTGRVMISGEKMCTAGHNIIAAEDLLLDELAAGVYFLTVSDGSNFTRMKLLKL